MRDLPNGWCVVKLKDCGTWYSGGTPSTDEPRFWGGDIPWISAASLKHFHITDSERRVTRAGSMAGTRLIDPGAVLFVVRGMSLKSEFRVGVAQRRVAFGPEGEAHVRWCFARPVEQLRDGASRLISAWPGKGSGPIPTRI